MLDLSESAILRAVGLLRAFRQDDEATFHAVLANEQTDPGAVWETFCAMTAVADRALDSVEHLSGDDPETVYRAFTTGLLGVMARLAERDEDDGTPDAA